MGIEALSDHELRGDYAGVGADFVKPQDWSAYSEAEHALWRKLYARQRDLLPRYAAAGFIKALDSMDASQGVPRFDEISQLLHAATGWRIVGVPGLIPNDAFFGHLAARRFPVTDWLRKPEEEDYLVEPDVFHDFFGHVPMLFDPAYADYMAAYGRWGSQATGSEIEALTRLYWYVVEFGLVREEGALKAFGAGILSSPAETVFSVDSASPHRVRFDADRVMRTRYRIDDFQQTYFVLDGFQELVKATAGDFLARVRRAVDAPAIRADELTADDEVFTNGDQSHARSRKA